MILKFLLVLAVVVVLQQNDVVAKKRKYIVCYHGTWATYRQSLGKYDVADIDPFLCTHLMYAFFGIEESGDLRVIDPYLDLEDNYGRGNIKKFNALKLKNPTLKTFAAVGGWNEGSKKFSIVAADAEKRARFVNSAVQFVQKYGFDGLDLDWEYPRQRHTLTNDDRNNFLTLLKELKEGLDPFGYMLTAAVGSAQFSAEISYNIPEVAKYLDLINVMAYDLHGPWDNVTGLNAPLYAGAQDRTAMQKQLNVDAIVKFWLSQGAPSDKLVIGVPFYGRSFTLEDADQHTPGSPHLGRGIAGQYSSEAGVIGYNELCEKMQNEVWTEEWEPDQMVPYVYNNNRQWVGYESPRSLKLKAEYVVENDLAGIMVWSLESDDFRGVCSQEKYPLLKQINRVFYGEALTATGLTLPTKLPSISITKLPSLVPTSREIDVCSPSANGYVRDPENCAKFYFCQDGFAHEFECPQTLSFDLSLLSCNYAQFVAC